MSEVPFNTQEFPPGNPRPSNAPSPARRGKDDSDVLRRRLQYALDEIAHLKQAREQTPQGSDEVNALRGQVEALKQALDGKSVELVAATEEREHLKSQVRALTAASKEASATAEQTGKKVRALRQMIAELQRQLDAKALELDSKNNERRRLTVELKRRTVAIDALQRRLEQNVREVPTAPGVASTLSGGVAEQLAGVSAGVGVLTLDRSSPGAVVRGALGAGDEPPVAPVAATQSKTFGRPQPVRPITPLLWSLLALVALTLVVSRWYGHRLGPNAPAPIAASAVDETGPIPAAPGAASTHLTDGAHATAGNPPSRTEGQSKLPSPQGTRDRLLGGGLGPKLVAVGPATFTMGSDAIRLHPDESPPREVKVGRYLIGAREITYAEYDRFARSTGTRLPDDFDWGRGQQPVAGVSWDDANAYVQWLSRQTGHRYRLPSEAEWEYAARGNSPKSYWWGGEPEVGRAVCFDCGTPWDDLMAAPVGSLAPNPFGLYDTAGNVMEWVGDCWNPDYTGAHADARARTDGDCRFRVARGGAFNKPAVAMRSAARYHFLAETRIDMLGFRVVRED